MLRAEGLGKRFGRRWIFRSLSFEVKSGEAVAILGRNGSGKSTLLRILSGLMMPGEGSVILDVLDPRLDLAMASVEQSLYPQLTVAEHLEFAAELRGCEAKVDELLTKVGLAAARNAFASQLSTGMKVRLRVAQAIQTSPKLLLMDEPGAALDEEGRALVEEVCREQVARGALILATNDPTERRLTQRAIVLS